MFENKNRIKTYLETIERCASSKFYSKTDA